MRWSKVRKLVEESFAPSVRGRVAVHVTNYPKRGMPYECGCVRGWFAVDGKPIAHFDTHLSLKKYKDNYHEASNVAWGGHPPVADDARTPGLLVEPAEFSGDDLMLACWQYLHLYTLNESLASPNPLIASLAVLSARVGKHRLRRTSERQLHPLTRALLDFRIHAEAPHTTLERAVR